MLENYSGQDSFTPTLHPKDGILRASADGYIIMVDSSWNKVPQGSSSLDEKLLTISVDVYCPSQTIFLRQESARIGMSAVQQMIQRVVQTEQSEKIEYIDKLPSHY